MITITKPEGGFACSCNCCYSRKDVREISFNNGRMGHVVVLCADCIGELADKLKEVTADA